MHQLPLTIWALLLSTLLLMLLLYLGLTSAWPKLAEAIRTERFICWHQFYPYDVDHLHDTIADETSNMLRLGELYILYRGDSKPATYFETTADEESLIATSVACFNTGLKRHFSGMDRAQQRLLLKNLRRKLALTVVENRWRGWKWGNEEVVNDLTRVGRECLVEYLSKVNGGS